MKRGELVARGDFPSAKQDQYMVRFPDGMRDMIKNMAEESGRSMNAQIIQLLDDAMDHDPEALLRVHKSYWNLQRKCDIFEALVTVLTPEETEKAFERALEFRGRINDDIYQTLKFSKSADFRSFRTFVDQLETLRLATEANTSEADGPNSSA